MNELVSTRWVHGAALMVSMLVVWVLFVPDSSPWTAALLLSLAFLAAFWAGHTSAPRLARVTEAVEAGRSRAVVTHRVAASVPKAVH